MKRDERNLIGIRFCRLIVISEDKEDKEKYGKYSGRRVFAKCDCGIIKSINRRSLLRGRTKSCGCLSIEKATKHGLSNKKIYNVYRSMVQRCTDETHWLYHRYGGRGITICEEWARDITSFYYWSLSAGYKNGLTIERKNNNKGYSPSNCKFVTLRENLNNTSKTIFLNINGKKISLQNACREHKINQEVVYQRIKKLKWSDEKAIKTPVRKMKKRKSA